MKLIRLQLVALQSFNEETQSAKVRCNATGGALVARFRFECRLNFYAKRLCALRGVGMPQHAKCTANLSHLASEHVRVSQLRRVAKPCV